MGADVRVRVRSSVVAVHVESAVVLVLVVVAANVQHNARSVIVAAIALDRNTDLWNGNPIIISVLTVAYILKGHAAPSFASQNSPLIG